MISLGRNMNESMESISPERVYCFDFDGVLCDSLDESLLTSYNTYFKEEVKSIAGIDPTMRDFFYKHRYLVRPAGEYYVLFHAFEQGETVVAKDRFLQLKPGLEREMNDHAERFYAYRQRFKKDLDYWLGLHRLYPECVDFLERRSDRFFIVTNKDKDSVVALARHHGYLHRIIEIYAREMGTDKKILLQKLIEDFGLNPAAQRIVFVDDHAGTLGEVQQLPLELYQAAWGYTGRLESEAFRSIHSLDELP
jgi:phosphoglycolate phosphatase-like HAD superfamily hydrolase